MNIKRKYRWFFTGMDATGNHVFPGCFVKWEGELKPAGGEIVLKYFFTMYDAPGQAKLEFAKFAGFASVVSGHMQQYDGAGAVKEEWHLSDVKISLKSYDGDDDDAIVRWTVSYGRGDCVGANIADAMKFKGCEILSCHRAPGCGYLYVEFRAGEVALKEVLGLTTGHVTVHLADGELVYQLSVSSSQYELLAGA